MSDRPLKELAEAIYQTVKGTQFDPNFSEIEWFKIAQACRDASSETAKQISVPRETLERWKNEIGPYWFTDGEDDSYNNDEIINLSNEIDQLLAGGERGPA